MESFRGLAIGGSLHCLNSALGTFGHHTSSSDRLEASFIQPLRELVGIDEMELQYVTGGTRKNGHPCAVQDEGQQRRDRLSVLRIC